jgi:regulator of sirC expression with transglutaminase-like and TPR domain
VIDPLAALEAVGGLPDPEIDIAQTALLLGRADAPGADWQSAAAHLTDLARDTVAAATDAGEGAIARVRVLAGILGKRHGYVGDTEDYDDLANANLIRVIERRRGMPVALGVLWLHCAQAADWPAYGIDFPGHFLLGIGGSGGPLVVDVFAGGRVLDVRALRALLKRVDGPEAELRPDLLARMDTRAVLLRLQNNVKLRRLQAGELPAALRCAENMLLLAPDVAPLWREAALMNQRLDHVTAALRCFGRYLDLSPSGAAAARARLAMEELRARLN